MKTIAFFNNKGGVGKTTLVYHLAWMFADNNFPVVVADLDPQSNLTSMFLDESRLEDLWGEDEHRQTLMLSLEPILEGTGDIRTPPVERVGENISLIVGDLTLSTFEDKLSSQWPLCLSRDRAAFRITSAFHRMIEAVVNQTGAELVLIDVGPNLGAINRSVLIAADHVVIPLAPDLFSLQGLRNLGPTLRDWREEWGERLKKNVEPRLSLPKGLMTPEGYVVMQHAVRLDRPVRAYEKWMKRIPIEYRKSVLEEGADSLLTVDNDPYCLAQLKHYRSLMPMAMEVRKPMFMLKPADGAIGSHQQAAVTCYQDFIALARQIGAHTGLRKF